MASIWKVGQVDIYVDEHRVAREAVRGELHVLDATSSTFHYSGAKSATMTLSGTVYGDSNLQALQGYCASGTSRSVTSDKGSLGSWYVQSVNAERRQALNESSAVYRVEIQLVAA